MHKAERRDMATKAGLAAIPTLTVPITRIHLHDQLEKATRHED
jgi:hypothetical protein